MHCNNAYTQYIEKHLTVYLCKFLPELPSEITDHQTPVVLIKHSSHLLNTPLNTCVHSEKNSINIIWHFVTDRKLRLCQYLLPGYYYRVYLREKVFIKHSYVFYQINPYNIFSYPLSYCLRYH